MTDQSHDSENASNEGIARSGDGRDELSVTSAQIQRAQRGDLEALSPVVKEMTPYLVALARSRLGSCRRVDPEDLVQEAWSIVLRRLPDLQAREGRLGTVLFRFLASTIVRRVNDHLRNAVRDALTGDGGSDAPRPTFVGKASPPSDVPQSVLRGEACRKVLEHLDTLNESDRELFFRRGLEGLPYELIARFLKEAPNTLAKRFQRLRERLRHELESAVLDDFLA